MKSVHRLIDVGSHMEHDKIARCMVAKLFFIFCCLMIVMRHWFIEGIADLRLTFIPAGWNNINCEKQMLFRTGVFSTVHKMF